MIVRFPTTEIQTRQNYCLKSYRTETPNIVYQIPLKSSEFKAYSYLCGTAGPKKECFKSNATICKELGICLRTWQKIKYNLCLPREELGGRPLIQVFRRRRNDGSFTSDLIVIEDIWGLNYLSQSRLYSKSSENSKNVSEWQNLQGGSAKNAPPTNKALSNKSKETTNRQPAPSKPSDFSSSSHYQEMKTAAKPQAKTIDPIPELEQLPLKEVTKRNIYRDFTKEQILAAIPAVSEAHEEGKVESLDRFAYAAVRDGYKPKNSHKSSNIKYFEEKKKLHADFVIMNRNEKTVQIDLGGNTPREISLSDPDFKQKLDESLHYLAPKPNLEGKPTLHTPMIGAIGNIDYNITMQKSFVQNMAQTPFSGPQIQHNIHSQNQEQVKNCTLFQSPIQKSTIPKLKEEIPESEELIKNRQEAKSLIEQNRELLSQKGIRLQARAKCILIERIDHRDIGINTRPIEYDAPDFKNRIDSLFGDASISHSNGPPFA